MNTGTTNLCPKHTLAQRASGRRKIVFAATFAACAVWPLAASSTESAFLPVSTSWKSGNRCAHVPRAGSAERAAIMDALRGSVLRATGQSVIFVVRHLKVSRSWAWAVVNPKSSDGTALEPLAALMRRSSNGWRAVRILHGDEVGVADNPAALRRRFPSAPADIFAGSHL